MRSTEAAGRLWPTVMSPQARPIADITPLELLDVVRKLERRGVTELSHRMLQTCGQVFRFGVVIERCSKNIAADLRGALAPHVSKPQPSIRPDELPKLLQAINAYDGGQVTRLGLQFLALTFVRTIELIGALWSEFDTDECLWVIPAPRMKMKREHIVPLSEQAIRLLRHLHRLNSESQFVFAGVTPRKHITNNTLLYALYRLGYHSRMTGHGFRALASTILNEACRREQCHSAPVDHRDGAVHTVEPGEGSGLCHRGDAQTPQEVIMTVRIAAYCDLPSGAATVPPGNGGIPVRPQHLHGTWVFGRANISRGFPAGSSPSAGPSR